MTDFQKRISKSLALYFGTNEIDSMFVTDLINVRYLSGFTGTNAQLFFPSQNVKDTKPILITDGRYTQQAQKECPDYDTQEYKVEVAILLNELGDKAGSKKIGFEGHALTYSGYTRLRDQLTKKELVPIEQVSSDIRMVKDKGEIHLLKEATRIAAAGFHAVTSKIKPGVRESEISLELEFAMRRNGGSGLAFTTIVASGARGALPHGVASDKEIEEGDMIVFDYGTLYEGYHSDETITFTVGPPDEKQQEIFQIVKDSQLKAIEAIKPGIKCSEIDRIARDYISDKGYGEAFSHSTGHGVGLEIHEAPGVSAKTHTILEEGMVITVEPGIYLDGWGGVRIEDMILVRADGPEVITELDKSTLDIL